MIEVTDVALRQAAGEGMDAFIGVFTGAYKKEIGGEMDCRDDVFAYR